MTRFVREASNRVHAGGLTFDALRRFVHEVARRILCHRRQAAFTLEASCIASLAFVNQWGRHVSRIQCEPRVILSMRPTRANPWAFQSNACTRNAGDTTPRTSVACAAVHAMCPKALKYLVLQSIKTIPSENSSKPESRPWGVESWFRPCCRACSAGPT